MYGRAEFRLNLQKASPLKVFVHDFTPTTPTDRQPLVFVVNVDSNVR